MTVSQRYLIPFGPKTTDHRFTDVLVIGERRGSQFRLEMS